MSPLCQSSNKVTLDIILTSIKQEIPFTRTERMKLPLPFPQPDTQSQMEANENKEGGCWDLSILCQKKSTTTCYTEATNFLKAVISITHQNKIQGTKSYYSAHSWASAPKDTFI